jgi:hypothetical protein
MALRGPIEAAAQPAPTASQIFELRLKCQKLGEQKRESAEAEEGRFWTPIAVTNYDIVNHHCYVKLDLSPAGNWVPRNQPRHKTYLYDGQTGELLAFSESDGTEKFGMVYDDNWEGSRIGFDAAVNYINKMMATKR